MGDEDALRRILINLIDNALRYSPSDQAVQVSVQTHPDRVCLCVADQGPGIPQADQEHIFERFYRLEADRNRQQGGTGLGLPIVKELVDWHQGKLELDSQTGQGTVFRICFSALPIPSPPQN